MRKLTIFLDFDGTVVEHQYPEIGRANFGCIEVIKKLQDAGHKIVLNTYRANISKNDVDKALRMLNETYWLLLSDRKSRETFTLNPITEHTTEKIGPHPFNFESAAKTGALFIDDQAAGTPLKPAVMSKGSMVDWEVLDLLFQQKGIYKTEKS